MKIPIVKRQSGKEPTRAYPLPEHEEVATKGTGTTGRALYPWPRRSPRSYHRYSPSVRNQPVTHLHQNAGRGSRKHIQILPSVPIFCEGIWTAWGSPNSSGSLTEVLETKRSTCGFQYLQDSGSTPRSKSFILMIL